MKVDVSVLSAAIQKLLDEARETLGNEVELSDDLYWFVQREELFDPAEVPSRLTLGSLYDDWEQVLRAAKPEEDPFLYTLVWASAVLRYLGDRAFRAQERPRSSGDD